MSKKKSKAQSKKKKNIQKLTTQETPKKKSTQKKTTTTSKPKTTNTKATTKQPVKKEVVKETQEVKETKPIELEVKEEAVVKPEIKEVKEEKIEETKIDTKEEKKQPEEPKKTLNKYQKAYQNKAKKQNKTSQKNKQVVDVTEVIYNVALKSEEEKQSTPKEEPKVKYIGLKEYIYRTLKNLKNKKRNKKTIDPKVLKAQEKERRRQEYIEKLVLNQNLEKEVQKIEKDYSKHNVVVRALVKTYRNLHVIFNAVIIATFLILGLAAFKVEVYETSTIIYFGSLLLFLILVAIFQNKYLSGKVFTILLVAGMIFVTSKIQYT